MNGSKTSDITIAIAELIKQNEALKARLKEAVEIIKELKGCTCPLCVEKAELFLNTNNNSDTSKE
jgi:hypothetical protein